MNVGCHGVVILYVAMRLYECRPPWCCDIICCYEAVGM